MKKVLLVVIAAVLVFALFACSDGTSGSSSAEGDASQTVTVSCEKFSADLPGGWYNFPYVDMFAEEEGALRKDALQFCKGMTDESQVFDCANIVISWSDPETMTADMRDMYENVEDVSITVDGKEWKGFTGDFGGYRNIWLCMTDEDGMWQVSGSMTGDNGSYSQDDADFQAILASVKVK